MEYELTTVEARVLGCLLEKAATTPEYYPLTMRALQSACNQKSNRDPVMELSEGEIDEALEELRLKQLAVQVSVAGSRVPKFKYRLEPLGEFNQEEQAVLALLLLRGPQTAGELRSRSGRLCSFDSLDDVTAVLSALMQWGGGALVRELPREPGRRESRCACLLVEPADTSALTSTTTLEQAEDVPVARTPTSARLESLETQVVELKSELAELKTALDGFMSQFN